MLGSSEFNLGRLFGLFGGTIVSRALGTFGTIIMLALVGLNFGAESVGVFAFSHGLIVLGGILSRQGFNNSYIKFLGQGLVKQDVDSLLRFSAVRVFSLSVAFVVIFLVVDGFLEVWLGMPGLEDVLSLMAMSLPFSSLCYLFSGFFQGVGRPGLSGTMEPGFHSFLAAFFLFLQVEVLSFEGVWSIGGSYIVSSFLLFFLGGLLCRKFYFLSYKDEALGQGCRRDLVRQVCDSAKSFFVMDVSLIMQSLGGVIVLGFVLSARDLGVFRVVDQVGVLIGYSLVVVNNIFPVRFSLLHSSGRTSELYQLIYRIGSYSIIFTLPVYFSVMLFPADILKVFGIDVPGAVTALRVVASVHLISVFIGPSVTLLKMTGYDSIMAKFSVFVSVVSLALYYSMGFSFGLMGAVFALSVSVVAPKIIALFIVWKKFKFLTTPFCFRGRD